MLFKKTRLILVLSVIFCMLFSSIPVYALNSASAGSSQKFTSSGGGKRGAPQPGGVVHAYFDNGPTAEAIANGAKPEQGYMTRDYKWHDGSSGKSTYDFFIDLLDAKIEAKAGKKLTAKKNKTFNGNSAYPEYKKVLTDACKRALQQDPEAQTARIVGVALTYRITADGKGWNIADSMSGTQHATSWDRLWSNQPSKRIPDYPSKSEFSYKNDNDKYVWFTPKKEEMSPDNKYFGQYVGSINNWAEGLYKKSKAESDKGDHNGMYIVIYAIAVTENMPDSPTKVRFHKSSDNTSITDNNAQYSVANCEFTVTSQKDGKLIGKVTTNADGYTPYINLYAGDYKVVETVTPKGYAGYSKTHYIHLGDDATETPKVEDNEAMDEDTATYTPFTDTSADNKVSIVFDESKNPRELTANITDEAWDENWWLMECSIDSNNNYTLIKNTKLTDKSSTNTITDGTHVFAIVNSVEEPTVDIQDGISYALDTRDPDDISGED